MTTGETSVDPREVAYYEQLASTWWDREGPFWPLHRLNALRVGYIRDALCEAFQRDTRSSRPLAGLTLLDVGCGGGILSEAMAALGAEVHGIDVVERNIAVARLHAETAELPLRYDVVTAESLAARGARYDAVLNMEVVEHVSNLPGFLHACARMVRPSGVMIVSTINRTLLSYLFAIVGAEYVLGWLPRGTHRWSQFRKPEEIERLLDGDGFRTTSRAGVRVNPLTRRFSLTSFLAVNYMLVARRSSPAL